eukprot:TRINITY_DN3864_c0_g1_i1.p1 TRINITY_DN3864_c0_g1~~TRINITY_DN3864_c0_g1_i1.p1  ORF type:complete len:186 (+),score=43.98 TRINITY_DN3864_c0_g1_i1:37-558(+)
MAEYKEALTDDKEAVVELLATTFCEHNATTIELGHTVDDVKPAMGKFFDQSEKCRFKALFDGKIVGTILAGHPHDEPPVVPGISDIMHCLYEKAEVPDNALLVHVTAVDSNYQGKGISSALRNLVYTYGQKNGYKYVMSESFSPITDHYYEKKGAKVLARHGPATLWCLDITE